MKSRTITFRLNEEEYQKCLKIALIRSNEEQRIVKISEKRIDASNNGYLSRGWRVTSVAKFLLRQRSINDPAFFRVCWYSGR